MARSIRWLIEALTDLDDIERFIARGSVRYSRIVAREIAFLPGSVLLEHPQAGGLIAEDPRHQHRQLLSYSYRLIYRVEGEVIVIVAVVHGARLLTPEFLDRR